MKPMLQVQANFSISLDGFASREDAIGYYRENATDLLDLIYFVPVEITFPKGKQNGIN